MQDPIQLEAKLASLEDRATRLVRDLRQAVEDVAAELLRVTEMTGDEVDQFLRRQLSISGGSSTSPGL